FHVLAFSRLPLSGNEIQRYTDELAHLSANSGLELKTHLIAHSLIGRDHRILQAESSQAFDAYGLTEATPQALFLIRPDGYIAYRADRLDIGGLSEFIRKRLANSATG